MKIKIAFYKGDGNIYDKLIRLWTRSPYSHCEIVFDNVWYTSSPRDDGVRSKIITPKEENWDYIELEVEEEFYLNAYRYFKHTEGAKYDWSGICLTQLLPLDIHSESRYFCSEWVADIINVSHHYWLKRKTNKYNPGNLYEELLTIKRLPKLDLSL